MSGLPTRGALHAELLEALAAVPPGERLNLAAIARALGTSQGEIVAAMTAAIADGEVDRATLRPVERMALAPDCEALQKRPQHDPRAPVPAPGSAAAAGSSGTPAAGAANGASCQPAGGGVPAATAARLSDMETALLEALGAGPMWLRSLHGRRDVYEALIEAGLAERCHPPGGRAKNMLRLTAAGEAHRRGRGAPPPGAAGAACAAVSEHPSGAQLVAAVDQAIAQRGMSRTAAGKLLFGYASGLNNLARVTAPGAAVVARVRAFLAGAPMTPPAPAEQGPSGAELADAVEALLARIGMTKSEAALRLFGATNGLAKLRDAARPRPATVAKVRRFLASDGTDPDGGQAGGGAPRETGSASLLPPDMGTRAPTCAAAPDWRDEEDALARRRARDQAALAEERARRTERGPLFHQLMAIGRVVDEEQRADFSTPGAVLRRAKADWPEQCAAVRALADELGESVAEIWRRVIAAGVQCLAEADGDDGAGAAVAA